MAEKGLTTSSQCCRARFCVIGIIVLKHISHDTRHQTNTGKGILTAVNNQETLGSQNTAES